MNPQPVTSTNWWTPDQVDYYLERYRTLRYHLIQYGGTDFDSGPRIAPGGLRYEPAFVSAVAILADLDWAIDTLPGQYRTIAHLYWRRGLRQWAVARKLKTSQSTISRRIRQCSHSIARLLCRSVHKKPVK